MNAKAMIECELAKAEMKKIARGTVKEAKALADKIHPEDRKVGNSIAKAFGGWQEVARRFPEILDRLDSLLEEDPNYNSQTLVGVTAMCRAKGFKMNMDGVNI